MDDPELCKVYGYLISTLNMSYPDYDFRFYCVKLLITSSVKPDQFQSIDDVSMAIHDVNHHLCEVSEIDMNRIHVDSVVSC